MRNKCFIQLIICDSGLEGRTYCYARVIQETCNTSAADINVLKTILYNVMFSRLVSSSCPLGKYSLLLQTHTNMLYILRSAAGHQNDTDAML